MNTCGYVESDGGLDTITWDFRSELVRREVGRGRGRGRLCYEIEFSIQGLPLPRDDPDPFPPFSLLSPSKWVEQTNHITETAMQPYRNSERLVLYKMRLDCAALPVSVFLISPFKLKLVVSFCLYLIRMLEFLFHRKRENFFLKSFLVQTN